MMTRVMSRVMHIDIEYKYRDSTKISISTFAFYNTLLNPIIMLATINEVLPSSYKVFLNRRCYTTEVRFVQKRSDDPALKVGTGVRIMEDGHMLPVETEHCHRCHVIREKTYAQQVIINKILSNKTLEFIRFDILNTLYPIITILN